MLEFVKQMREELQRKIDDIEETLKRLPTGSLFVQESKEGFRLYWDHKIKQGKEWVRIQTRLRDCDYSIARGIQKRLVLTMQLKALKMNLRGIDRLIRSYQEDRESMLIQKLTEPYRSLLGIQGENHVSHLAVQSENTMYREDLVHENSVGELFRSKAEMNISELLLQMKIPYRYEKKLVIDGKYKYPDFTLKHAETDRYVYIEYFGMTDEEEYQTRMFQTINWYLNHQLIPGRDVLFLYENSKCGMKMPIISRQIREFLGLSQSQ